MESQNQFEWTWPATRRVSRSLRFPEFISFREADKTRKIRSSSVRAVMFAIEDHAGVRHWCSVSNTTLAAEASVTLSQAKRALFVLDQEGLIIRSSVNVRGKTERNMRPNWDQYFDCKFCSLTDEAKCDLRSELMKEAGQMPPPRSRPPVPERGAEVPDKRPPVPESRPPVPPEGPQSRSRSKRKDLKSINRVIGFKFSSSQLEQVEFWIGKITACIDCQARGSWTPRQNWEFMAKISVLTVSGSVPEAWLAMAIDSIRHKSDSVSLGYLVAVMRNNFEDSGGNMAEALKSVVLPDEFVYQEVS